MSCFPAAFAESPLLPSRTRPSLTVSTCDDDITATTTTTRPPPLNNDNLITPNSPATTTSTCQITQTPGIHTNTINSDPIFQKIF